MPTTKEPTLLEQLLERRQGLVDAWSAAISARETERAEFEERSASDDDAKKPSDEQRDAYNAAETAYQADSDQREAEIKEMDERIRQHSEIARRTAEAAIASKETPATLIREEALTYRRDTQRDYSYWRDLVASQVDSVGFGDVNREQANERLRRHAQEMDVEVPKRVKLAAERAYKRVDEALNDEKERRGRRVELRSDPFHRGHVYNPFEQRVEPNRTDGYGGYFVPPLWMVDEWIAGLRAHLVAAGLCRQFDLPGGTDSINIPKLSTLTTVGYQQADNAGLPTQDWTDTVVQANVKTLGGYSDVALQLLEQSPNGITDEVITSDLMAAYNTFLDQQVISGDGTSVSALNGGHIQGIYNGNGGSAWTGYNGVTWTASSPAPYSFVQVLGAMASQIAKTRYDAEQLKFVVHGRRGFWYLTGLDGNDRPLGETSSGGPFNIAAQQRGLQAEGLVATLPSIGDAPLYIDDNIPTTDNTDGGGATRDVALGFLADDMWLFLGDLRTDVFREVLSGTMGIRFRLYNYVGFLARYGQSIAVATGTGFVPPSGQVDSSIKF